MIISFHKALHFCKTYTGAMLLLFACSPVLGQDTVLNHYSGEAEIRAARSVTLKEGFYIPVGNNVRIFTLSGLQNCVNSNWVPSASQNYIRTRVFKEPGVTEANLEALRTVCAVNQTVQYIDGLGRLLQTVTVQGSPTFRDVVQPVAYDAFGREEFKYLPYSAALSVSNGSYKADALGSQAAFYNNPAAAGAPGVAVVTNSAFSRSSFEASPLNRLSEQGSPGIPWQPGTGHTLKTGYGANAADEVKLWKILGSGAQSVSAYPAGKLYKTASRDENVPAGQKQGSVEEFKDLEGHVVLKRIWESNTSSLNTYYIYDDLGNLSYVLPPAVSQNSFTESDPVFEQYIYGYRYDGRNRVIRKKVPGKGWESMVYNQLDQLVLSQDSVQRLNNQWLFNKYDAFGRTVVTGLYTDVASRATLQVQADNATVLWEKRTATGTGYSNDAFPAASLYYHTISYYDTYDFPGNTFGNPDPAQNQVNGDRVKGLQTGSKVAVLGTASQQLLSVNYYDDEGRVLQTKSVNHLGGTDIVNNSYNFAGELLASKRVHTSPSASLSITNRFEYDHMGRKKASYEQINTAAEVLLSRLDYNETGQLGSKQLHSTDQGNTFLQQTSYGYNERGWLKKSSSAQFSMELKYEDGTVPQFNGNISKQNWGAAEVYPNSFSYGYDGLNRLTSASSMGVVMSEVLGYDVMGNITSLNRDNLGGSTYSYTGNRLDRISTGPLATGVYSYDANGNAKLDGRNGVSIVYNYLNLPASASKTGLNLAYTYDATGNKLRKVSNGLIRDYIGGIEYNGNSIELVHTEEGVARNNGGVFSYEYNLTDHLGNVRYTFRKHPVTGVLERLQSDDYYAFGKRKSSGSPVSENNKYLYNGKEIQDELGGQYDYGARFYDPVIGRWNVIDPKAEDYDRFSPYNYVTNNPINLVDPDGTSVEDGPHYLASTYVGGDGKIIKHINDGDRNIYFVPDASKWNGDKQNLSIIGREREGVNYNEYVGRSLSQTPFDRTKVQLRGENQKEQLSLMVGVLSRFGPQGISQSFALDGLLSPHLSAYLAFINILELIGDSRITLSKGTDRYTGLTGSQIISKFKKGGIREVFPEEYNDETWEVIGKEANRGVKAARTAKKLLTENRFNK